MIKSMRNAVEAFKSEFTQSLKKHPDDVCCVDDLDEMIHQACHEIGAFSMQAAVKSAVDTALATDRTCSCGGKMLINHRPKLKVQTIQGSFEDSGVSFRCNSCGTTQRPAHKRLGVDNYLKTSRLFDRLAADFFLDKGAPTSVARIKEHHGIEPGRTTVLRRTEQRGQQARVFVDAKIKTATEQAETKRGHRPDVDTVFVQMDSSSSKTVLPLQRPFVSKGADVPRTPVRRLPKTKRPIKGRQVKLLCAQAKGASDWIYDAYVGDYEQAPEKLIGLAAMCGWQDGVMAVMTADGDEKIREMAEGAFQPDLQMILDQQHAIGHLRDVVTYGKDAVPTMENTDWVSDALSRLRDGQVQNVVAEIDQIVASVPDPEDKNKVENVATYFRKRCHSVNYEYYKEQGWPQGSGAVEGGHIHKIHPISKRGAGWLVDNLNNVLALACIRGSGWWDEFWQWAEPAQTSVSQLPQAAAA